MQRLNAFLSSDFIFSPRYRLWRHLLYWSVHIWVWAAFWTLAGEHTSLGRQVFNQGLWIPVYVLFSYPLVYGAIPHLLLKGKLSLFFPTLLAWGVAGLGIEMGFRSYLYIPLQEAMGLDFILPRGPLPSSYLAMTTSAAIPMAIKFFKLCAIKQRDWMQAQGERITAELQLLKSQVHPLFLIHTLDNLYALSSHRSPQTPGLILKLSSLLSYMIYDCKADEVRLEKELEIIQHYIHLQQERSAHSMEVSWSVEGNTGAEFIAPLLMWPFLENAFKHGTSRQIETPWLSVDLSVKHGTLRCKIANSKDEWVPYPGEGKGITAVRKRLEFIYPGRYELKLNDEVSFFVVSLSVKLTGPTAVSGTIPIISGSGPYENALPVDR
jgi:two-component system sensor histidine kinase AlgZ